MTETAVKKSEKLLHAYIVTGGNAATREEHARRVAKAAVCERGGSIPCGQCAHCRKADKGLHPDIMFVDKLPDKTELTVDVVRSVRSEAYIMPNEAERKVYIIRGADKMNEEAQNAILKILEEPPTFVVFLILIENPARLLPTVRSRCALMTVREEERALPEAAEDFVRAVETEDKVGILSACLALEKVEKDEFAAFLEDLKRAAVSRIRRGGDSQHLMKLTDAVEEAEKYMTVNVSRLHVASMILSRLV